MTQEDRDRYMRAAHAMQTGVAFTMPSKETEPKHLRVGINSAMVSDAAIATLLIEKGIFTLDEYEKAVADAMENEVELYKKRLPANVELV